MSSSAKHIVFICSRLDQPGGTERANLNAAHLLLEKGHRVSCLIADTTAGSFYPIDRRIGIIHRNYSFGIGGDKNFLANKYRFLKESILLSRELRRLSPDIVISTDYVFSVAAITGRCHRWTKVFSWEHHHYHWLDKSAFWKFMIKTTYPSLQAVLVYNPDETKYYERFGCRTAVIPNFITEFPQDLSLSKTKTILTVGWLIERKGVDLIPAIASRVLAGKPDWIWKIIGRGELYDSLQAEIEKLGLKEKVIIEQPALPLTAADYQSVSLFVMTSRIEPFGLVLIEAMSNGIPCIAFDCETGPRHIITQDEDGFLIPPENMEQMAGAIAQLIENDEKRLAMGKKAREHANRFSADAVYQRWRKIIEA